MLHRLANLTDGECDRAAYPDVYRNARAWAWAENEKRTLAELRTFARRNPGVTLHDIPEPDLTNVPTALDCVVEREKCEMRAA